jgi:hypothetical protein
MMDWRYQVIYGRGRDLNRVNNNTAHNLLDSIWNSRRSNQQQNSMPAQQQQQVPVQQQQTAIPTFSGATAINANAAGQHVVQGSYFITPSFTFPPQPAVVSQPVNPLLVAPTFVPATQTASANIQPPQQQSVAGPSQPVAPQTQFKKFLRNRLKRSFDAFRSLDATSLSTLFSSLNPLIRVNSAICTAEAAKTMRRLNATPSLLDLILDYGDEVVIVNHARHERIIATGGGHLNIAQYTGTGRVYIDLAGYMYNVDNTWIANHCVTLAENVQLDAEYVDSSIDDFTSDITKYLRRLDSDANQYYKVLNTRVYFIPIDLSMRTVVGNRYAHVSTDWNSGDIICDVDGFLYPQLCAIPFKKSFLRGYEKSYRYDRSILKKNCYILYIFNNISQQNRPSTTKRTQVTTRVGLTITFVNRGNVKQSIQMHVTRNMLGDDTVPDNGSYTFYVDNNNEVDTSTYYRDQQTYSGNDSKRFFKNVVRLYLVAKTLPP